MPSLVSALIGSSIVTALLQGLGLLFLLLLLYIVLRREWLAVGALGLVFILSFTANFDNLYLALPFCALWAALSVFVLTRLGLLAFIFFRLFTILCVNYPLTADFTVWYAQGALFALTVAVAFALYGFRTSLAGRPLWRGRLLED